MLFPIQYDEPLYRPPSEAYSLILQVTIGCSWNKCGYCEMYTTKKFKTRKEDEVLEEIKAIGERYEGIRKVFLADGNAMVLSFNRLVKILEAIQKYIPSVQRVASYAMPQNLSSKTPEQLQTLREMGLKLVYVGIESGNEEVLKRIDKGETQQSTIDGMLAAKEAGIKRSVMILNGVGGKKFLQEHAIDSAKVLNVTQPEYASTLVVSFPLGMKRFVEKFGERFIPLNQEDLFQEMKIFLSHLELDQTIFRSDHASNYLVLKGTLNKDKEKLLTQIEKALTTPEEVHLRQEWQRGL